jgi:hypothetical protein
LGERISQDVYHAPNERPLFTAARAQIIAPFGERKESDRRKSLPRRRYLRVNTHKNASMTSWEHTTTVLSLKWIFILNIAY